mmetsp:Transcript_17765/g.38757  ORF Transcript_17765/g.38757 Transcript_17765/m.38757 type:complete len:93 (+) Transcript_17765:82-360(+)
MMSFNLSISLVKYCPTLIDKHQTIDCWGQRDNSPTCLKSKLSSAPVTTFRVIFDGIVSSETNPLRKRAILPLLLSEGTLRAESLLRWHLDLL